jgi:hypothetical protein
VPARVLRFALDDLRARFGAHATPGVDPRGDTAPFRAFRAALLDLAARAATGPAELSFWWEGTFNGYLLAIAAEPDDALAALDPAPACPPEDDEVAAPRTDRYPLGHVEPGRATVACDADGAWEAPFGAPTGHFGAPGVRRVR